MESPLYLIAQIGFVLLSIVFLTLLILEIRKGVQLTAWDPGRKKGYIIRIVITLVAWTIFVSVWSLSGKMSDFSIFPLNFLPVILIPLIAAVIFISSKALGEVLRHIPPYRLIRLQSFRFFVEVLLWLLFVAQLLPVQMTFEGRNLDILAGFTAPIIAVLASKGKISNTGIIVWNLICLALLLNIVITAILSTPSPWRVFMNEPANYIVTYFPISLLPGLLVPLAYYLHFMSLRQAWGRGYRG
jgi:hypothetical protein